MTWWALAAGLLAWGHLRFLVPRLPEPVPAPADAWVKPPYATLASPAWQAATLALGTAAGWLTSQSPGSARPLLLVLAGPVAALVVVDLRTTYLPRWFTSWCWVWAAPALASACWLDPHPSAILMRCLLAAGCGTAVLWLVWRLVGGLGFGDVRLVGLLALGTAAVSVGTWQWSLVLGSVVGVLWGVVTAWWRRRHPHPLGEVFAYGPALWLGVWLALLLA